jgi:3-hydroxyisobutyrate dehydrogenase-like beta-hydroxyacid dehydrogenase
MNIGILHPGTMGAALATAISGEVFWAGDGRSDATKQRARDAGITDTGSIQSLTEVVDVIMSVCPPRSAPNVAAEVNAAGFDGVYVDLNAVSPATTRQLGRPFARFVDGGIVGPPPPLASPDPGDTRLYLSGRDAPQIAGLFTNSHVDARIIGHEIGQASALKMAYAAWTKGTSALLLSVAALAKSEGVAQELFDEWNMSIPELEERLTRTSARVGTKAWRFAGEMEEIAASFSDVGLPDGFHLAAADLYSRLAGLKDEPAGQSLDEVISMVLGMPRSGMEKQNSDPPV